MLKKLIGAAVLAVSFFVAMILVQISWGLLMGDEDEPSRPFNNVVVIPSQTPAGASASDTPIPFPTNTPIPLPTETPIPFPTETPIPLPTNTLISSASERIDDLFLGVMGVTDVEVASEKNDDARISGVAIVTISPEENLYIVRDAIWTSWVYHAQRIYSYEKPLFIDLTITQNGIQSIWQRTSGLDWIQVGGTVPIIATNTPRPTLPPRPANCSTAVAMNMSDVEAAAAGLDRDGDGVACYGD